MPFCPTCRQEFETFASACPDCDVTLTPELAPEPVVAPADEVPPTATLLAPDGDVATLILERLRAVGMPAAAAEEPSGVRVAVLIPKGMEASAIDLLTSDGALEVDPESSPTSPLIRRSDASSVEKSREENLPPLALDLLSQSTGSLVGRGSEVIAELLEIVRRGEMEGRQRAIYVICRMGTSGVGALTQQLPHLARAGNGEALYHVTREIRDKVSATPDLDGLVAVAEDVQLDVERRGMALHALGRFEKHPQLAVRILPILSDPEEDLRELADEALCSISDEDMGFDPGADESSRAESISRWRAFFRIP